MGLGRLDRVTRRFLDADLEAEYQREAGQQLRESVGLGQLFGGLLWLGALLILPQFAPVDTTLTTLVIVGVWVATVVGYLIMRRLEMLDDLQTIVLVLNVISMAAALAIATLTPGLQHQAAPAVIVVAQYAFIVLRLRFAFAVVLAIIHVAAFTVFTVTRLVPTAFALELFLVVRGGSHRRARGVVPRDQRPPGLRPAADHRGAGAGSSSVEKAKSDDLLSNVLPESVAQKKRDDPDARVAEAHDSTSVLFADLVGFTPLAERLSADETVDLLNGLFTRFDRLVEEAGLNKVKTIGDAYMIVGGAPDAIPDHALRVVRIGLAMLAETEMLRGRVRPAASTARRRQLGAARRGGDRPHRFAYDMWGDTVNVASRMESHGVEGRLQISEATWRLVRDEIRGRGAGPDRDQGQGTDAHVPREGRARPTPTPAAPRWRRHEARPPDQLVHLARRRPRRSDRPSSASRGPPTRSASTRSG